MIAAGVLGAGLARACASASARAKVGASRQATARAFERATNLRPDEHDLVLHRGRCLKLRRGKRCPSRYGVIRLTLDLRDPDKQDISATLECALCSHTWHRTRTPLLRRETYQRHRMTLILPPARKQRRYVTTRGRKVVEGESETIIAEARYRETIDALADWRKRHERRDEAGRRRFLREQERKAAEQAAYAVQRERIAQLEAAIRAAREDA